MSPCIPFGVFFLLIPIVGQFDLRFFVTRCREKDEGEPASLHLDAESESMSTLGRPIKVVEEGSVVEELF